MPANEEKTIKMKKTEKKLYFYGGYVYTLSPNSRSEEVFNFKLVFFGEFTNF